ncbi:MAG: hypothetical protein MK066_01415 [Crocinitomicaceae bacterium]|nr:hypothetical protein [Crocinitomicaceae bacterium]
MNKIIAIKGALSLLLLLTLVSCKEKKDTLVEIYVVDIQGNAVANATVELLTSPPYELNSIPVLHMKEKSDQFGIAYFNFNDVYQLGQAGVAVLDVDVIREGKKGHGILKVEQEITNKEQIVIHP